MDIDDCLAEIRRELTDINEAGDDHEYRGAHHLAELVESLDVWMSTGGFKPKAWIHDKSYGQR